MLFFVQALLAVVIPPCAALVLITLILCITASDLNGGPVIKGLFGRRMAIREREQRHRHRMDLLKQLEKIASFEGLANSERESEYGRLRDHLLADLDTNLDIAATDDGSSGSATPKRPHRSRT